jgi:hypothetical protein
MPPVRQQPPAADDTSRQQQQQQLAPFRAAARAIQDADDLKAFLTSATAQSFVGFILSLNQAVAGVPVCERVSGSGMVACWHSCVMKHTTTSPAN